MKPDVFISYSRENQQQVIKLVEYLRGQGLAVWMDETDIHGATIWTKEIVEAIRACDLFILAISRHSTGSKNVVKELALASEREKIILPIYLEQCDIPETMEYQLAGIQNIALYTLEKAKAYEFVHQTIRRLGVGQSQQDDQALGQAKAASSTGIGHGHMAPPKAKGGVGKWIAIAAAVVVLGIAGFFLTQGGSGEVPAPKTPATSNSLIAPVDGSVRIAVLPFENLSTDDNQTKWADLISQEIIGSLATLNGVTPIVWSSVNKYRGEQKDIDQITRELNVQRILDGRVVAQGGQIEVSFNLTDTQTKSFIWNHKENGMQSDFFKLRNAIVAKVTSTLKPNETPQAATEAAPTENMEAYKLYRKARELWSTRGEAEMKQSIELYEEAIEMDSNFVEAYCGLGDAYAMLIPYGYVPPDQVREAIQLAEDAFFKAIKINPNYSGAYPAMGWLECMAKHRHDKALEHFDEALKHNPNNVQALMWKAITCRSMQRSNEAIKLSSRAIELDPNNHVAYMLLCLDYASDFQYENAEKAAKKSVSLKPDYGMGQNALFNALAMQENKKEELKKHIESLEALSNKDWSIEQTIFIYHYYFGTKESFSKAADYMKKKAELTNYELKGFPLYFFCTGEKELGYKYLEEGVKNGNMSLMGTHRFFIEWSVIKDEDRYKAIYGSNY
ncbi:MAG: TIR domain-containing protein [Verrucomicrobiota bacterium]|nr:TIR domain-containing protein [Verrucomicrobiota bacterium]